MPVTSTALLRSCSWLGIPWAAIGRNCRNGKAAKIKNAARCCRRRYRSLAHSFANGIKSIGSSQRLTRSNQETENQYPLFVYSIKAIDPTFGPRGQNKRRQAAISSGPRGGKTCPRRIGRETVCRFNPTTRSSIGRKSRISRSYTAIRVFSSPIATGNSVS